MKPGLLCVRDVTFVLLQRGSVVGTFRIILDTIQVIGLQVLTTSPIPNWFLVRRVCDNMLCFVLL